MLLTVNIYYNSNYNQLLMMMHRVKTLFLVQKAVIKKFFIIAYQGDQIYEQNDKNCERSSNEGSTKCIN